MAGSLTGEAMRRDAKSSQTVAQAAAQGEFFYDDIKAIERHLVAALGGPDTVGPLLFPHKNPIAASRYLSDCTNPNREHALGEERFMLLLKLARERGIHLGLYWVCDELRYARPPTVEPEDQAAEILRRVDIVRDELGGLLKQLERLPRAPK